ncbi:MAG: ATP-binding protein [Solirubrobacterales bacterium]|nr:ATP-binding protein [Solirubrobacterales bacterium]MBV9940965.1 ATP-binding protein [Solirubrobacterales bacterium]
MSGEIDAPWVRLELTSRPEAARLVRGMATAAGQALAFDPELLADVNTAVTEACNNVILHAYGSRAGPLAVEMAAPASGIEVRVRDQGRGIRSPVPDREGLKVGLALMSALADRAEFLNVPDGGTEVRLSFRIPTRPRGAPWPPRLAERAGASTWQAELHLGLTGDVVLTVSPVTLLGPVLGHIGRALAPSAGFSLQRCSDVYLLSDVLGTLARQAAQSSTISVALGARHQLLEFALAPLRIGTSARLDEAGDPQGHRTLARLTEKIAVSTFNGHETLRVSMRDHLRT